MYQLIVALTVNALIASCASSVDGDSKAPLDIFEHSDRKDIYHAENARDFRMPKLALKTPVVVKPYASLRANRFEVDRDYIPKVEGETAPAK